MKTTSYQHHSSHYSESERSLSLFPKRSSPTRIACFFLIVLCVVANPLVADERNKQLSSATPTVPPHSEREERSDEHFPSSLWKPIAHDLQVYQINIWGLPFVGPQLTAIRSSLRRYRIGLLRAKDLGMSRATVKSMVLKSKAIAGINASFFDEEGSPLGVVISRGIVRNKLHRGGSLLTGVFQVSHKGIEIVARSDFSPTGVVEAIQSGPRLVHEGIPVERDGTSATSERSGVCIDAEGRVVFVTVTTKLLGVTMEAFQELLAAPPLGCAHALNLDGGGSTQLFVNLAHTPKSKRFPASASTIEIEGSDKMPVALGLFIR